MDPELYRDSYVGTAASVVSACNSNSSLNRIIFTSSLNAYGDGNGEAEITEETKANPLNPFQEVYIETERLLNSMVLIHAYLEQVPFMDLAESGKIN